MGVNVLLYNIFRPELPIIEAGNTTLSGSKSCSIIVVKAPTQALAPILLLPTNKTPEPIVTPDSISILPW